MAEQQQPPQVAVAHHLGAHPGRPGHDAHAAGWAPSRLCLPFRPARPSLHFHVDGRPARARLQLSVGGWDLRPEPGPADACRTLWIGQRTGKIHWRNTREQLSLVGPRSLGVALLTASFVGMVFTIQVETSQPGSRPCVGSACGLTLEA